MQCTHTFVRFGSLRPLLSLPVKRSEEHFGTRHRQRGQHVLTHLRGQCTLCIALHARCCIVVALTGAVPLFALRV